MSFLRPIILTSTVFWESVTSCTRCLGLASTVLHWWFAHINVAGRGVGCATVGRWGDLSWQGQAQYSAETTWGVCSSAFLKGWSAICLSMKRKQVWIVSKKLVKFERSKHAEFVVKERKNILSSLFAYQSNQTVIPKQIIFVCNKFSY